VYGYDQRVEVFGSAGMVVVANRTPEPHVHFAADGVHSSTPLYFFLERYSDAYVAEMREFVRCVVSGTKPPVTGRDGLVPVIMGLAATKSLRDGRPVRMTEIGETRFD
jgi:myo-inositol 2-dehydrogenase/D-chiro-inositol 1-dehydrogenase